MTTPNTRPPFRHEREFDIQLLGDRVSLSLNSENLRRWPGQWRKKNESRRVSAINRKALLADIRARELWRERRGI